MSCGGISFMARISTMLESAVKNAEDLKQSTAFGYYVDNPNAMAWWSLTLRAKH